MNTTQPVSRPVSQPVSAVSDAPERLLGHQRREKIVIQVRRYGAVRVRALTEQFGVSDMTIRRDIEALDAANRVKKVHGGATVLIASEEPGFDTKSTQQLSEKARIGIAAASMVEPGSAIGITAGTTTFQMAEHLASVAGLTVVTNSLPMASALNATRRHDLTLVIIGGSITPSAAIVGPVATRALESLHLDQVFMGIHGMGENSGFTTPNLPEAHTNQAFIGAAAQLVVVSDSTKWETIGMCNIAPLAAAHVLVTDDGLDRATQTSLSDAVGELVIV